MFLWMEELNIVTSLKRECLNYSNNHYKDLNEYTKQRVKGLEGLTERELALIRFVEFFLGKLTIPSVRDKHEKQITKEEAIVNLNEMKRTSLSPIFGFNAGPFHSPDEILEFTTGKNRNNVKSLYFNFAKNASNKICMLHFHGGAYVTSTSKLCYIHERWCYEKSFDLLGLEYTTFPNAEIEEIIEEAFKAFKWLVDEKHVTDIYLIGESAGGNLSLNLADKISHLSTHDSAKYITALKGAVLLSPWFDLTFSSQTCNDMYNQDRLIPYEKVLKWKMNGVPCGLNEQERAIQFSPYFWSTDKINQVCSVLPKGIFISYTERERLADEVEKVIDNMKGTTVRVFVQKEKVPFHVFHAFMDFLPDQYKRTVNGIDKLVFNM